MQVVLGCAEMYSLWGGGVKLCNYGNNCDFNQLQSRGSGLLKKNWERYTWRTRCDRLYLIKTCVKALPSVWGWVKRHRVLPDSALIPWPWCSKLEHTSKLMSSTLSLHDFLGWLYMVSRMMLPVAALGSMLVIMQAYRWRWTSEFQALKPKLLLLFLLVLPPSFFSPLYSSLDTFPGMDEWQSYRTADDIILGGFASLLNLQLPLPSFTKTPPSSRISG